MKKKIYIFLYWILWYRTLYYDIAFDTVIARRKSITLEDRLEVRRLLIEKFWHLRFMIKHKLKTSITTVVHLEAIERTSPI